MYCFSHIIDIRIWVDKLNLYTIPTKKMFCFHTPEEEPQCRGASGDGEGESVFVAVGKSILTVRSCEPKDGRQPTDIHKRPPRRALSIQECEVFLQVTEQVMYNLGCSLNSRPE